MSLSPKYLTKRVITLKVLLLCETVMLATSFVLEQVLSKSQFPTFDTEVFHKINHYGSVRTCYPKHLDFSTLNKESK